MSKQTYRYSLHYDIYGSNGSFVDVTAHNAAEARKLAEQAHGMRDSRYGRVPFLAARHWRITSRSRIKQA